MFIYVPPSQPQCVPLLFFVLYFPLPQRQAHNREAVEVTVHRMARRLMHAALLSWRQAAQERRVRRTAIARFIQVSWHAGGQAWAPAFRCGAGFRQIHMPVCHNN